MYGQDDPMPKDSHFTLANNVFNQGYYDSAVYLLELSSAKFRAEKAWGKLPYALALQGDALARVRRIDEAKKIFNTALNICEEHLSTESLAVAKVYEKTGGMYDFQIGDFDQALYYYNLDLKTLQNSLPEDHFLVGSSYLRIGGVYWAKAEFLKAKELMLKGFKIIENKEEATPQRIAGYSNNVGLLYYRIFKYDSAVYYIQNAINIWNTSELDPVHPNLASFYNSLSFMEGELGHYQKQLGLMKNVIKIREATLGTYHELVAQAYHNLGLIYRDNYKFEQALAAFNKAMEINVRLGIHENKRVGNIYRSMADFLLETGDLDGALDAAGMGMKIYRPDDSKLEYTEHILAMVRVLRARKEFQKAVDLINEGIQVRRLLNIEHDQWLGHMLHELAGCYIDIGDFNQAMVVLKTGLEEYEAAIAISVDKAGLLTTLSKLHFELNEFENAMEVNNQALRNFGLDINSNEWSLASVQFLGSHAKEGWIMEALITRIKTIMALYGQRPTEELMDLIISTYGFLTNAFYQLDRKNQKGSYQRIILPKISQIYEIGMDWFLMEYQSSGNGQLKQMAMLMSEESRAILLKRYMLSVDAMSFTDVPDSLLEKERAIKERMSFLEKKLINDPSDTLADGISTNDAIIQLYQQFDAFATDLRNTHPKYYEVLYQQNQLDVRKLQQKIKPLDLSILNYHWTDSILSIFVITADTFEISRRPIPSGLSDLISATYKALLNKQLKEFVVGAHRLYTELFAPVESLIIGERITVIAPGELSKIPFEVFIKEPIEGRDSKSLDYLLKYYSFSYNTSEFMIDKALNSIEASAQPKLVGFAPTFSNSIAKDSLKLSDLPYADEEVKSLINTFRTVTFSQKEATEGTFKDEASNFDIIHLATHTILDHENPQYSRILFAEPLDSAEDGALHAYEIYNLMLNSELVTLSACNSGVGPYLKGEGAISLARAFAYAGCPNILMSLWPAQDKSTAEIMESFYEYLSVGWPKDQALRQAKLDFLDSADKVRANPYFWAGFVLVGDASPVKSPAVHPARWVVAGVMLFLLLVLAKVRMYS